MFQPKSSLQRQMGDRHEPVVVEQVPTHEPAASAGHTFVEPSHFSETMSHAPIGERHTVPEGAMASAGQLAEEPVQNSSTSQLLPSDPIVLARHKVVAGLNSFAGQTVEEPPAQTEGMSQSPAAERNAVPADFPRSAGQALEEPEQISATSQLVPSGAKA